MNVDPLRESFYGMKRKAAPEVDGMTWKEYDTGPEDRLNDLHGQGTDSPERWDQPVYAAMFSSILMSLYPLWAACRKSRASSRN